MRKYKWSLYKTLEFLNSRRPDLEIKASFIRQLSYYEKRLYLTSGAQSDSWTELATKPHLENEELIIAHTYLNAQVGPFASHQGVTKSPKNSKLKWIDETTEDNNPEETKNLRTNASELDLCLK